MDNGERLQLIRSAQGDPALLALATVDLTFSDLPGDERAALRLALEAAAVPHWCDSAILAALIGRRGPLAAGWWEHLKAVPVVESFPARGVDAGNVHEVSRIAIRKRLAEVQRAKFTELSTRSARLFEADTRPVGRIEWIYHLLVADPERGASELEDLGRTWLGTARHEDLAALSAALSELDTSHLLRGRALIRARLVVAGRRAVVAGAASLSDVATQLRQAAETIGDDRLTADAYSLVGEVTQARGDLAGAEQAFAKALVVSERLVGLDPGNAGWRRELAAAYSRVGGVAQARGDLAGADRAFSHALAISEQLAGLDPTNTDWRRDLADAYCRVGEVAQTRGDLAGAERAFTQVLAISERLAGLDPTNTDWQRDLAVAYSWVGGVAQRRGDLAGAEEAFAKALVVSERLAGLDPGNAAWRRELAVAYSWVGGVAQRRGDLVGAEEAFTEYLVVSEQLAALDPTNTDWQRDLAVAYNRVGDVAQRRGDLVGAERVFNQDLAISQRLAALDPTNTDWQRDLAAAYNRVGDVAQRRGDLVGAERAFNQDLAISQRLAGLDPTNTDWQRDLATAYNRIGGVAQRRGDLAGAEHAFAQALAVAERLTQLDPGNTDWQRDLAAYLRVGGVAQPRGHLAGVERAFIRTYTEEKPDLDTSLAHSARIWNYWLGGKDNFSVDRDVGEHVREVFPAIVEVARASRAFLVRVVTYLAAEAGIRQFLDVGTGLPSADNTHEVAQLVAPKSRVVYVDNDPLVLVHARALLTSGSTGSTDYIDSDVRNPDRVLREAARTLDFNVPIALMMLGILGHITDNDEARRIVKRLVDSLPSGSYLVINDRATPVSPEARVEQWGDAGVGIGYIPRTASEIARYFDGLDLLEPGIVSTPRWRPDSGSPEKIAEIDTICGVGRKP